MLLVISGGHGEDAIGARLLEYLAQTPALAFPLVGEGNAYRRLSQVERVGPLWKAPSGGFPANSLLNLWQDLRAGLLKNLIDQYRTAQRLANNPMIQAVVAVGDAWTLLLGLRASAFGKKPLFHLQTLISYHYIEERSLLERLRTPGQLFAEDYFFYERFMHRFVRAVYVRDPASEQRARALGMEKARFVGSMAMDTLGPPEGPLPKDGRPVLALLPGTRGDVVFSLPKMLEAARKLPEFQPLVAWIPPFEEARLAKGYRLEIQGPDRALAIHPDQRVWLLKGRFSAILHSARVAVGTAGTANEQSVGLGVPVVGFPTPGPQYTYANALRQKRLLGEGLTLVAPDPKAIAEAVRALAVEGEPRKKAQSAGRERFWPLGALPRIACEIRAVVQPQKPENPRNHPL